jgi:hypothetical protein
LIFFAFIGKKDKIGFLEVVMRGINFQSMLKNWDLITHKLCEEVSTHDVLNVVTDHVKLMIDDFKGKKLDSSKVEAAYKHLQAALKLLDPEG